MYTYYVQLQFSHILLLYQKMIAMLEIDLRGVQSMKIRCMFLSNFIPFLVLGFFYWFYRLLCTMYKVRNQCMNRSSHLSFLQTLYHLFGFFVCNIIDSKIQEGHVQEISWRKFPQILILYIQEIKENGSKFILFHSICFIH